MYMTTAKLTAAKATAGAKKAVVKKVRAPVKTAAKPAAKAAIKQPVKRMSKAFTILATEKKAKKEHKIKVVRDSFTMPQSEYQKIADIKAASLKAGLHVKKSEVLRAGLQALAALTPLQLKRALAGLEKVKTGRPKSAKKAL
jgi:hypothetical protein